MTSSRRAFIKASIAAPVVAPLGFFGCSEAKNMDRSLKFKTLADGLLEAEQLAGTSSLESDAVFSLPQTFVHLAQSIEYSITGFPQAKSALFQRTVGSLAFNVFAWRGHMSHGLDEPIPGAEILGTEITAEQALVRLRKAIETFNNAAAVKPHFAYGVLSKEQYDLAHAMHLANHFSAFRA